MGGGFHYIDIVFFALVAAFLILRLRSVLGRRTGNERPPPGWNSSENGRHPAQDKGNVIDLTPVRKAEPVPDTSLGRNLAAIAQADRSFSPDSFVGGASSAFEMILGAFTTGDKQTLRPLLSDDVFGNFAGAIDARAQAGDQLDTRLVGIRAAEIVEGGLTGSTARVTVRFTSEQTNVLKDREGRIIEGDPDRVTEVVDEWTFQRDVRSPDPNWLLVATRSA